MVGVGSPVDTVLGIGPGRPDNLVPAAVVEADVYLTALIVPGNLPCPLAQLPQLRGQRGQITEKLHFHPVPLHLPDGLQQVLFQKPHDGRHLRRRPLPVLGGKGVDGEVVDADVLAVGGDDAEGLRPGGVAGGAGKALPCGPAAVAVHDDGDVPGQTGEVHLCLCRLGFFREEGHGRSLLCVVVC